jgi:hypothetical protein
MLELANFFYPSPIYLIVYIVLAVMIGFIGGYLLRSGIIARHKKRILSLEEEMLSNHSHILTLEKEISDLKNGKSSINGAYPVNQKIGSKTS